MPNQDQINAAAAVLKTFATRYGGTASDTMLANCVFSMYSALGGPGQPSAEYAEAVKQATGGEITVRSPITMHDDGSFTITADNVLGLPKGTYRAVTDEEEPDELPSENSLMKMKKDDIIAQAVSEGITGIDEGDPNKKDLVKRLLAGREVQANAPSQQQQ